MKRLDATADEVVNSLLAMPSGRGVSILDSCGVGHLGSHLLIAGVDPVAAFSLTEPNASEALDEFERIMGQDLALIFTISYDLGLKFEKRHLASPHRGREPDIHVAQFDALIIHDYDSGETFLVGNQRRFEALDSNSRMRHSDLSGHTLTPNRTSNLSRNEYIAAVEAIKELIRNGDTYQANLTQKFQVYLNDGDSPQDVFWRLRNDHPAPFAAFLERGDSIVVSASPERFFKIDERKISVSPIKGTRSRSDDSENDTRLRDELLNSEKDRAENTMIVDLVRNDLGRVCEFGSVRVKDLCALEEHPTLLHLVSTVEGQLREEVRFADVFQALFPCGSITGAPKIRTMQIIGELEPSNRGLSMGAIGYFIPETGFDGIRPGFDLSVAIRTMVIRGRTAEFNVGGGITIESDPNEEYEESLLKAKALFSALGNNS